jgi:uncharacterized protein YjgD (DUF1641 family)
MSEILIQSQIDEINHKLDIILEEVYAQKETRENLVDLIDDLTIVGKDFFRTTVVELDKAGIELDRDQLAVMILRAIRNIGSFNQLLETLESFNDLMKDMTPIIHQVGLDAINKMNELEQKGYIAFFKELSNVLDNVVTHYSTDDIKALSDNIVSILETIRNLTQPDMLKAMNNAVNVFKKLEMKDIPEYSMWKLIRELRDPELRKGIGLMVTFLKNLSREDMK